MDVIVRTGHTRAHAGSLITPHALETGAGEHVVFLLEAHGDADSARTMEQSCLETIQHALLSTEGDAAARLDGALKELNGLLKGLLVGGRLHDVHLLIAICEPDGALHVSHAGRSEGYLVRKGSASQITEYTGGKPTPAFVHIASGGLEPKDVIVLSTQRLLRTLTPAQLGKIAARGGQTVLTSLTATLEGEGEGAALALIELSSTGGGTDDEPEKRTVRRPRADGRGAEMAGAASAWLKETTSGLSLPQIDVHSKVRRLRGMFDQLLADLSHPTRKKRAHLLLLAGALAALVAIWAVVHIFTLSQLSRTEGDLQKLVTQINESIKTAENRRIIGKIDDANDILEQAEERANQIIVNKSGLYRAEALNLLQTIQSKREELNNIIRIPSPRIAANVAAKNATVSLAGLVGIDDGEFYAYDQRDIYRVLLNSVDNPSPLGEGAGIVDAVSFPRYDSVAFLTTDNSVVELSAGETISMKTEDPNGWVSGEDVKSYQRNLYILSATNRKIYKYERLTNRYAAPVQYNVNGDLTDAIDLAIDGNIYALKRGGTVLKFYRGEVQPFKILRLPKDAMADVTKAAKQGNFYFLDPVGKRVIVTTDGGANGESLYVKQYVLEGEQVGTLKDIYVDPEDSHLYVMDDQRIYIIDLMAR